MMKYLILAVCLPVLLSNAYLQQSANSVPLGKKTPALKAEITCPDNTFCSANQTCCQLSSGGFGCCPYPQADCCSDGLHCCPNGFTCDLSTGRCTRGQTKEVVPLLKKKPSFRRVMVTCPDGTSCGDQQTCCKSSLGSYGCCPYPNADCCSDGVHCCPNGYTCNLAGGTCDSNIKTVPILPQVKKVASVTCADGSFCSDSSTCCRLSSGGYGCCPYVRADCCSDGLHCCPAGYTCNLASGTCQRSMLGQISIKVKKIEAKLGVNCPDGSFCSSSQTCCQLQSGGYGCCPYPNADCCSDGLHCCPNGYTCDLNKGTCERSSAGQFYYRLPLKRRVPAIHL